MNLRTIVLKETRPLFAAWCAITLAGAIPALIPFSSGFGTPIISLIFPAGFWIGLPLLATLSFGHEFQHRTISLLLSQPIDRMKIWNTKWILACFAVLSSSVFYAVEQRRFFQGDFTTIYALTWILVVISSAAFWTLFAQSTIGGLVLNLLQAIIVVIAIAAVDSVRGAGSTASALRSELPFVLPVAVIYSGFMIWLGRRKFAQLEATGTLPTDDALVHHPMLSRAFTKWLRCHSRGAVLNLFRKEVRLLWPIWLFTILCIVILAALWPLQFLLSPSSQSVISIPSLATLIVAAYGVGAILLTGSVSVGEEKALGARRWQLTLPLSTNLQWLVKLSTVLIAAAVGLISVVTVAEWLFGQPFITVFDGGVSRHDTTQLLGFAILSIVAFWTACAVNGTVRAILWAIPASVVISSAYRIAEVVVTEFREVGVFHLAAVRYHRISFSYDLYGFLVRKWHNFPGILMIAIPLVFVLLESRRLFRKESEDNILGTIRTLLRPAMLVFLLSFSLLTVRVFAVDTWDEATKVLNQAHQDIVRLGLDLRNTDASHPRQLSPSEVDRVIATNSVRRWLDTPRIFVFAGPPSDSPRSRQEAVTTMFEFNDGLRCTTTDMFSHRPNGRVIRVPFWSWTKCRDTRGNDVSPWR
jgi:hypothetical protein